MATFQIKTVISAVDNITGPIADINKSIKNFTKPLRDLYNPAQKLKKELGFPKVASAVRGVSKAYGGVAREVKALGTDIAWAVGGATAAVSALAWRTSSVGDAVSKTSQKVGISAESWSMLAYAADQSGVSASTLQSGLSRLNKSISEAARGGKKAAAMFNYLGVSIYDADGKLKTADAVMSEAADKLNMVEDAAHRSTIAMEMFGRSAGVEMLPLLAEGADGIEQLKRRAEELGLAWSEADSANATAFGDTMEDVRNAIDGVVLTIGKQLLPILTKWGEEAIALIVRHRELIGVKVGEWIQRIQDYLPTLKENIKAAVESVSGFALGVDSLVRSFGGWSEVMPYIVGGIAAIKLAPLALSAVTLTKSIASLSLSFAGMVVRFAVLTRFTKLLHLGWNLFIGIAGAFKAVLVPLAQGILAFGKGVLLVGKILSGMLVKGIIAALGAVKALFVFMAANPVIILIAAIAASAYLIYQNWDTVSKWLMAAWAAIKQAAAATWDGISAKAIAAWNGLCSAASTVWGAIVGTIQAIFTPVVGYFAERIDAVKSAFAVGLVAGIQAILLNFHPVRWIVDAMDALTKYVFDFSLKDAGTAIINSLLDGLKAAWEVVVGWFKRIGESITGLIPESVMDVLKMAQGIAGGISDAVSNVAGSVAGAVGDWWSGTPSAMASGAVPVEQSEALQFVQQRASRQQEIMRAQANVYFHNVPSNVAVDSTGFTNTRVRREPLSGAYTGMRTVGMGGF